MVNVGEYASPMDPMGHNHGSVEKWRGIWKVTILLEIHPFLTEPWLWEEV